MGKNELVFFTMVYGAWVLPAYLGMWGLVRNAAKEADGVVTWGNVLIFLFFPLLPVVNAFTVVMTVLQAVDSIKDKPCFQLKRRLTDAEVEALIEEIQSLKRR